MGQEGGGGGRAQGLPQLPAQVLPGLARAGAHPALRRAGEGRGGLASSSTPKTCDKSADAQQLLGLGAAPGRRQAGRARESFQRCAELGEGTPIGGGVQEERRAAEVTEGRARARRRSAPRGGPRPSAATSCGSGSCAASRAEDVARVTRLAPAVIEAIEAGDPERMPPRGYLVGYLRSYAGAVGLDADDVVLRFQEAAGADEPVAGAGARRVRSRGGAAGRAARRSSPSWWRCSSPRRWPSACGARAATPARSAAASRPSARPTAPPARRRRSRGAAPSSSGRVVLRPSTTASGTGS